MEIGRKIVLGIALLAAIMGAQATTYASAAQDRAPQEAGVAAPAEKGAPNA